MELNEVVMEIVKKAQELLENGVVVVKERETAKHFLKRGNCSEDRYDRLIGTIIKAGCLQVRFAALPEVQEIMKQESGK